MRARLNILILYGLTVPENAITDKNHVCVIYCSQQEAPIVCHMNQVHTLYTFYTHLLTGKRSVHVRRPNVLKHISSVSCVLHALHISSSLIRTPSAYYDAPQHSIPFGIPTLNPTDQQMQTVIPGAVATFTTRALFSSPTNFLLSWYSKIHLKKKKKVAIRPDLTVPLPVNIIVNSSSSSFVPYSSLSLLFKLCRADKLSVPRFFQQSIKILCTHFVHG